MNTILLLLATLLAVPSATPQCTLALPECPNFRPPPAGACASKECTCFVVCQYRPDPCAAIIAVCQGDGRR